MGEWIAANWLWLLLGGGVLWLLLRRGGMGCGMGGHGDHARTDAMSEREGEAHGEAVAGARKSRHRGGGC